jgi:hypothetical protein
MLQALEHQFPAHKSLCIEPIVPQVRLHIKTILQHFRVPMYGIVRDKNFPTKNTHFSKTTKIPNFFMTAKISIRHGILGCNNWAFLTCAEFLGLNTVIDKFAEEE